MTEPFALIPKWLVRSELSPKAVMLYLALANFADKDGRSFPSRKALATEMGVKSVSSVSEAINELKEYGAVEITPRYFENSKGRRSSYYTLVKKNPKDLDRKSGGGQTDLGRESGAPLIRESGAPLDRKSGHITRPTFNETHVELITGANATGTVETIGAEPPEPGTAEGLIAEWRQSRTNRPPNRVVEQLSKQIEKLLDEGFDYDRVRQAVGQWQQRGLRPSTLPSVLDSIQNGQNRHGNASAAERRQTAGQERDKALAERTAANQTPLDPFALEAHQRQPQKQLGNGDAAA